MVDRRDTDDNLLLLMLLQNSWSNWDDDPDSREIYRYLERAIIDRSRQSFSSPDDDHIWHLLRHRIRRGPSDRRDRLRSLIRQEMSEMFSDHDISKSYVLKALRSSTQVQIDDVRVQLSRVADEANYAKEAAHEVLWGLSLGVNFPGAEIVRFVPFRIYLADAPDADEDIDIRDAVRELASLSGMELAYDLPEESGSWWKRFLFRTKEAATCPQVCESLKFIGEALRQRFVEKPRAEADARKGETIAGLIKAIESSRNACVQFGSNVLVKRTSEDGTCNIVVRDLTMLQLARLEEKKEILKSPELFLTFLGEHSEA